MPEANGAAALPQRGALPQRLSALLAADRTLNMALPEARQLAELNRLFARAAPPGLRHACRVMALRGQTVLVYCSYGAAAARLRSQARTLAQALSTPTRQISALKIKVRADWPLPEKPAKPGMSEAALTAWHSLEQALPPGELKAAVQRLLWHQRRGQP